MYVVTNYQEVLHELEVIILKYVRLRAEILSLKWLQVASNSYITDAAQGNDCRK
jgi:hypothetical protein